MEKFLKKEPHADRTEAVASKLLRAFDAAMRTFLSEEVAEQAMRRAKEAFRNSSDNQGDEAPGGFAGEQHTEKVKTQKEEEPQKRSRKKLNTRSPYQMFLKRRSFDQGYGNDAKAMGKAWSKSAEKWRELGPEGKKQFAIVYAPLIDRWTKSVKDGESDAITKEVIQEFEATLSPEVLAQFGFTHWPPQGAAKNADKRAISLAVPPSSTKTMNLASSSDSEGTDDGKLGIDDGMEVHADDDPVSAAVAVAIGNGDIVDSNGNGDGKGTGAGKGGMHVDIKVEGAETHSSGDSKGTGVGKGGTDGNVEVQGVNAHGDGDSKGTGVGKGGTDGDGQVQGVNDHGDGDSKGTGVGKEGTDGDGEVQVASVLVSGPEVAVVGNGENVPKKKKKKKKHRRREEGEEGAHGEKADEHKKKKKKKRKHTEQVNFLPEL